MMVKNDPLSSSGILVQPLACGVAVILLNYPGDALRKLDRAQNTYIDSINIHQSTMPSNHISNNIDFVPPT